ncbi:uncharacterized protein RHIMIDRAFT_2192 [Rhizopus microsporus ATCC 52813]|uniref:Uncharacterized protein n=1 Tax=Rhizopus microsporus ATCC 52813 TaxID=1340429 RepID=A0A2G4T7N8_RHIZD|nr:uncharacterized protein RHIMIDRAFT_2192 [Rhizopus microsporus ATCC 52813]PHZ17017.1 hypothetical protein RHIMIDRAFT_2192 [Rhizopus microsporus ATCC 52813]
MKSKMQLLFYLIFHLVAKMIFIQMTVAFFIFIKKREEEKVNSFVALQSTLNDKPTSFHEQRKMHNSSSNSSITSNSTNISNQSSSSNQSNGAALYKLTDDDNQRLIASEKVKRKSDPFRHKVCVLFFLKKK